MPTTSLVAGLLWPPLAPQRATAASSADDHADEVR